ncbi:hypothetical protein [Cupriavidus basilensis]
MSSTSELPRGLYKANVALQVRLVKLQQESSQRWRDDSNRLINNAIDVCSSAAQSLMNSCDWQKMPMLPADSFRDLAQQRIGESPSHFLGCCQ